MFILADFLDNVSLSSGIVTVSRIVIVYNNNLSKFEKILFISTTKLFPFLTDSIFGNSSSSATFHSKWKMKNGYDYDLNMPFIQSGR